ncbi:hypothetical protein JYU34_009686, partial [Plutella xylostella]
RLSGPLGQDAKLIFPIISQQVVETPKGVMWWHITSRAYTQHYAAPPRQAAGRKKRRAAAGRGTCPQSTRRSLSATRTDSTQPHVTPHKLPRGRNL